MKKSGPPLPNRRFPGYENVYIDNGNGKIRWKKFPQFYLDTSGIVKPIVTSPAKSSEDLKLAKVKLLRQSSSGPFRSEPLINDYEQIQTIPVHGILPTERLFAESDDVTFQKINRIQDSDFNLYFPIAFESPFIILLRSILDLTWVSHILYEFNSMIHTV